jgi:3-oxoadipate enol-lactonase
MKIKANGITINCRVEGPEGAPWVVFSNSLATNLSMWDEQAAALSDRFRVLRYDHRGHGGTEAPQGKYDFAMLVADVIGLCDHFGIGRAHFVGLSMGGMTAIALAEAHPDRVERIVPCDCGPASSPQSAAQWAERIQLARKSGMDALVEPTVGRWFTAESLVIRREMVDKIRQMIRTTPVNGFIGCCYALSDFDLRPGLARIAAPTLFLCGEKDAALPGIKALHASVAGSTLLEIPSAGHIANVENPETFTRALMEFLAS